MGPAPGTLLRIVPAVECLVSRPCRDAAAPPGEKTARIGGQCSLNSFWYYFVLHIFTS